MRKNDQEGIGSGRKARKRPSDLVAADISSTGIKVLRVKNTKSGIQIHDAKILPLVDIPEDGELENGLNIPENLLANYAAITVTGLHSVVRLLTLPGQPPDGKKVEDHIREHVGLNGLYRLSYVDFYKPGAEAKNRKETRYLAVALPEEETRGVLGLVSNGAPAPRSLEVSGLAALNGFLHLKGAEHSDEAVGFIETGAKVCFLAFIWKGDLVLVRKFDFGGDALVSKVQQQMGVDEEVAQGIIADGSFDISGSAKEVLSPFLRQLSISRDFVERKENLRISKLYISGGMSNSQYWLDEIKKVAGTEVRVWNPFEGIEIVPGAWSDDLVGQETRFAAAVGAAMGCLS